MEIKHEWTRDAPQVRREGWRALMTLKRLTRNHHNKHKRHLVTLLRRPTFQLHSVKSCVDGRQASGTELTFLRASVPCTSGCHQSLQPRHGHCRHPPSETDDTSELPRQQRCTRKSRPSVGLPSWDPERESPREWENSPRSACVSRLASSQPGEVETSFWWLLATLKINELTRLGNLAAAQATALTFGLYLRPSGARLCVKIRWCPRCEWPATTAFGASFYTPNISVWDESLRPEERVPVVRANWCLFSQLDDSGHYLRRAICGSRALLHRTDLAYQHYQAQNTDKVSRRTRPQNGVANHCIHMSSAKASGVEFLLVGLRRRHSNDSTTSSFAERRLPHSSTLLPRCRRGRSIVSPASLPQQQNFGQNIAHGLFVNHMREKNRNQENPHRQAPRQRDERVCHQDLEAVRRQTLRLHCRLEPRASRSIVKATWWTPFTGSTIHRNWTLSIWHVKLGPAQPSRTNQLDTRRGAKIWCCRGEQPGWGGAFFFFHKIIQLPRRTIVRTPEVPERAWAEVP